MSPDAAASDDIFGFLEALESVSGEFMAMNPLVSCKSNASSASQELVEAELRLLLPKSKRLRLCLAEEHGGGNSDGEQKASHIRVERNQRKQMNEHLTVLHSLMPCFYVKRGDQASIIGGVVDYITELQQILQTLEAKKQIKIYREILSLRFVSSPGSMTLSIKP